ncbi:MAG: short-chain dehydrogenase [Cytophagaceae bacterium]|nr:short-chain dehydrogenase [Cytophagaceae bacterium]|tara:strand:+ start:5063 stop:5746 length:684 start_codon:yes stop_codon:yes gene_type:complete
MEEKRVAVVTEAGGNGLGKSFANILIKYDYEVVLAASKGSFEKLTKEENNLSQYNLFEVDFKSRESLTALKKHVLETYGKLDLLINNAEVVNGFGQKIDQINIDEVRELYEVNLFAVIQLIQLLKPLLEKSDDPSIINITSALGDINKMRDEGFCYSGYGLPAYATSKAALNMYTHLQCREFKPSKIAIHTFDPIAMKNCTHNSVFICDGIKDEFVSLIKKEKSRVE